jgi:hypothetical protein
MTGKRSLDVFFVVPSKVKAKEKTRAVCKCSKWLRQAASQETPYDWSLNSRRPSWNPNRERRADS